MDKICELIKQAHELIEINNPIQLINDLNNTILKQKTEINNISNLLKNSDDKYLEQIKKLELELELKTNELKQKNEDLDNLAKFSIIQKVNKQLEEKNNYILILESQIEKFKKNIQPISPKLNESVDNLDNKSKKLINKSNKESVNNLYDELNKDSIVDKSNKESVNNLDDELNKDSIVDKSNK